MRHFLPVSILCLAVIFDSSAQSPSVNETVAAASKSSEMAQRVLQYELMLGTELSSNLAVCVDAGFTNTWMLPARADLEAAANAIGRVRRRLELCQANSMNQPAPTDSSTPRDNLRLGAEIRTNMESQLKAAKELEQAKLKASNCLKHSQTQDSYKNCVIAASSSPLTDALWSKWIALFDRRTDIVALELSKK